ncbi:PAS domain S-box protein [Chloroflexota bacterium]
MKDEQKTKQQLLSELAEMRQVIVEFEISETERKWAEHDSNEYMKELACLCSVANIGETPDISLDELCQKVANVLPQGWQYPESACARIIVDGKEFKTKNYRDADWKQSSGIIVSGGRVGIVEVEYLKAKPEIDEGPFLKEERLVIDAVAERLGRIIEQKRMGEALRESEEKFSKAFRIAPDPMTVATLKEGRFIDVNESYIRIYGYQREEVIGRSSIELGIWINPEQRDEMFRILQERGHVSEFEIENGTKSGELRTSLFSAEVIDIAGELCLITSLKDITDRKQSEDLLVTISENSPIGIYIVQDRKLLYGNRKFQELTGYSQDELLGTDLLSLIFSGDRDVVRAGATLMLNDKIPYPYEYRIINKSGEIRWVMETVASIQYQGKRAALGNCMDISERKLLENKIFEYEELNRLKSDLLSTVSHELRTPLATIKGYSTMIQNYNRRLSGEEKKEYLHSIDGATDRLTELVDHLLDMSRLEAGLLKLDKSPTNMCELIKMAVVEGRLRSPGYNITANISKEKLPKATVDSRRIREELDN